MKTHRLLLIAITGLLLTAVPPQSSAADVTVDISSFAPLDTSAALDQIELNVLLKQYEKVLTQLEDALLQRELESESISADASDEQKKQAKARQEKRESEHQHTMDALEHRMGVNRDRIEQLITKANKRAAAFEKQQREAMKATGQSQPNGGTLMLRGKVGEVNDAKAPQTGSLMLNGPLMLKGSNEYTNPTNVPANVQPTPAK